MPVLSDENLLKANQLLVERITEKEKNMQRLLDMIDDSYRKKVYGIGKIDTFRNQLRRLREAKEVSDLDYKTRNASRLRLRITKDIFLLFEIFQKLDISIDGFLRDLEKFVPKQPIQKNIAEADIDNRMEWEKRIESKLDKILLRYQSRSYQRINDKYFILVYFLNDVINLLSKALVIEADKTIFPKLDGTEYPLTTKKKKQGPLLYSFSYNNFARLFTSYREKDEDKWIDGEIYKYHQLFIFYNAKLLLPERSKLYDYISEIYQKSTDIETPFYNFIYLLLYLQTTLALITNYITIDKKTMNINRLSSEKEIMNEISQNLQKTINSVKQFSKFLNLNREVVSINLKICSDFNKFLVSLFEELMEIFITRVIDGKAIDISQIAHFENSLQYDFLKKGYFLEEQNEKNFLKLQTKYDKLRELFTSCIEKINEVKEMIYKQER